MATNKSKTKVVIVGGGFAGLAAARALSSQNVEITLFDRKNHHTFQPLLYQVATATLAPSDIAQPIRSILSDHKNIEVVMDNVIAFDKAAKCVKTQTGISIGYDYLIVATGASHSYFGNEHWERFAPGLKSIEDALHIRSRILSAFEIAERQMLETGDHKPINFIVIGAGPTGVELAGAIADTCNIYLCRDFHLIKTCQSKVFLLEAADRILLPYPEELAKSAARQLQQIGVQIMLGTKVTDIQNGLVVTDKGTFHSSTTVWAAGVQASALSQAINTSYGAALDKRGCVVVDQYLNALGHSEIFIIGDLAHKEQNGKPLPGVAQAALQMGAYIGKTISADLAGQARKPFVYIDRGDLATIGRARAVANIKWPFKAQLSGAGAWISWLIIHIFFLIGLRNRLFVFVSWLWTFFSRRRGVQLITMTGTEEGTGAQKPDALQGITHRD
ncbi:MAG: NAD(P)/FAD-dependent oxidoreductase [Candidatus Obscuribacter sp.]|nr:NAD(P)/FAD-dependent oxidoreductase [Candidatus Obscuribacter sp.]